MEILTENVWTVSAPFTLSGLKLGGRMTVIKLADGSTFIYSPVHIEPSIQEAVASKGPVKHILAPCLMHHLFVHEWKQAFPEARTYAAPKLPEKRQDIDWDVELSDDYPKGWPEELEKEVIKGIPTLNEVVLYHKPSKTLILTDLLFHLPNTTGFTKLYAWMTGLTKKPSMSLIFKSVIKDKKAFGGSLDRILSWDVEQISLCHHQVATKNCNEILRQAFKRYTAKV